MIQPGLLLKGGNDPFGHIREVRSYIRTLHGAEGDQVVPVSLVHRSDGIFGGFSIGFGYLDRFLHVSTLLFNRTQRLNGIFDGQSSDYNEQARSNDVCLVPSVLPRHGSRFADNYGFTCIVATLGLSFVLIAFGGARDGRIGSVLLVAGITLNILAATSWLIGCLPWDWGRCLHDGQEHSEYQDVHSLINVSQKHLTSYRLCNTVIVDKEAFMANILSTDKQIAVIGALAEGSSIRSIERIIGVHRDTIMRLGVRVGQGCAGLLNAKMRHLPCRYLQFDEV